MISESGWGSGACFGPGKEHLIPSWRRRRPGEHLFGMAPDASSGPRKCCSTWPVAKKAIFLNPHGPSHLLTQTLPAIPPGLVQLMSWSLGFPRKRVLILSLWILK